MKRAEYLKFLRWFRTEICEETPLSHEYFIDKYIANECVGENDILPLVSNSLVADIRNKLTPPKNLCAMIKALPRHILEDTQFEDLIIREVEQTEKSIEYLSNL